ncbi:hypothetical protein ACH4SP_24300 [Streptomyces sp. NPDC021093]|uniref:hypothetical protein n=1 Tax=Streptomyces sp. NPDC021093 TaxID=3365112 RepID=UPI00378D99FC
MQHITRGTAGALAAVVLFAGTVTACTDSPGAHVAPDAPDAPGAAQAKAEQAEIRSSRELQERARALLSDPDELADGEFVASGSSADPRSASQSDLGRTGTSLVVEVACVGQGAAAFTVSSGRTRIQKRVDCTSPAERIIQLNPAGRTVMVETARGEHDRTAVAYLVRRTT